MSIPASSTGNLSGIYKRLTTRPTVVNNRKCVRFCFHGVVLSLNKKAQGQLNLNLNIYLYSLF
jgi:hypothetical protein